MKGRAYLHAVLLTLVPLAAFPLCGPVSCNRGCPDRGNPCELIPSGPDINAARCVYPPANGATCNYSTVGDGTCRDGVCVSAECEGVEFFQGCDEPMSGGFEGACIEDFCASVAPIDECVKEGIGRINCCSQEGCASGQYGTECDEPLDSVPCDPSNLEPPGIDGQKGTCVSGFCVPNAGETCAGAWCAPSSNVCKRIDLDFAGGCGCQDWPVDGMPPCGVGKICFSGTCALIPGLCTGVDCSDGDDCTRDGCDPATAVNGSCGPDGTDCCVHTPEPAGTLCELPGSPGQFGYCSSAGDCEAGPARNELSMGCTDNLDATVKLLSFELTLSPQNQRVPAGSVNSVTVDGVLYLPQTYLDGFQNLVTGGADKVDVRGMQATAAVHHGATGNDVLLTEEPIPYTCALGASVPCDPANDLAGIAGHRGNTDCAPVGDWNTCGRFVPLPISTDCDPGGVCVTGDWNGVRQGQCASNGFCITDRLGLALQGETTLYQPDRRGYVLWGWDDSNTGATVQQGGPNDGTWLLPPADYAAAIGPNGLRLIFFNSVGGTSSDVALECTMGVDSQGRYGVYSADPLSSPTPMVLPDDDGGYLRYGYWGYADPLHTALAIYPTGLLASSDVCLYVSPDATTLTPSSLCDVDDADGAHSFEIHYDDAACSGPLDIDYTQSLSIDLEGNFGLDPVLADHFAGSVLVGGALKMPEASGSARSDSVNCSTSWGASAQSAPLPEGTTCDWTNAPCELECLSGGCDQVCAGEDVGCTMDCPGGSCTQSCDFAASCTMGCASNHDCSAFCGGTPCVDPGECKRLECPANSASCSTIDSPNGTACDFGHPVPATCSGGGCTSVYGGYVEASMFDPPGQFWMMLFSTGQCCFETPIEAQLAYPAVLSYVDPSLCDSYIENVDPPADLRLRLNFVTGGGWCCGNTVADVLAAYPNREICDGRPPSF